MRSAGEATPAVVANDLARALEVLDDAQAASTSREWHRLAAREVEGGVLLAEQPALVTRPFALNPVARPSSLAPRSGAAQQASDRGDCA
jgi:hypothetical protein